jgi:hypothetical protein
MKFLTALAVACLSLAALTTAHATMADANSEASDTWGEEAKEWECAMPRSAKADGDRDPVYKTEIYVTYRGNDSSNGIASFNVRHVAMSGMSYERASQYAGISVASTSNRRGGTQTWSGHLNKNPRQQIVGELRYASVYSDAAGGPAPNSAVYSEKIYMDGKLQTSTASRCHWTGPAC